MITVFGHKIEPTKFPDGTTQVWKLPGEVLSADRIHVDWRFEREEEFFALAQLRTLVAGKRFSLHVPYLPYARQDKDISNELTFALRSFGTLLNVLRCEYVSSVDVHNLAVAQQVIERFRNQSVENIHHSVIEKIQPDFVVFPDEGAKKRYPHLEKRQHVVFAKEREQGTGRVLRQVLVRDQGAPDRLIDGSKLLLVDDICDDAAAFLMIAQALTETRKNLKLDLFVTHGLFSTGREALEKAGFKLHTTNSLPRNPEGIPV